jgi:hypothetical protein
MTQIPILSGIYTNESSDFRTSYPRNLIPVPKANGISEGYLRPAYGLVELGPSAGIDRGGINWRGVCYRVMGPFLVSVSENGTETILGNVGNGGLVTFDYSFDRLAVCSDGRLYYWDGTTLTQVTDPDLGEVLDFQNADGRFVTTDGEFIVVTELNNPLAVDPLKYGSSEVDPDPVLAIKRIRTEIIAINRHTIESFSNVGGTGFPYARIEGAQVTRGAVGTHACCVYLEAIAFVGGGRNESVAAWIAKNGVATKISTREIDQIFKDYAEAELSGILVESVVDEGHQHLYIHLPDKTLVYDAAASLELQQPIWFILTSSIVGDGIYRARNFVWCYNKWLCGDPLFARHGYTTDAISSHYGEENGWEFGTQIIYNQGLGVIFHELELVCLSGRVNIPADPVVWTSYSKDGEVFSQERAKKTGRQGQRNTRINWLSQGSMRNWRMQKFRGTSDSHLAIARLEARLEPLNG